MPQVWSDNLLKEASQTKNSPNYCQRYNSGKTSAGDARQPNGLLLSETSYPVYLEMETNVNGERGFYLQSWNGDGRYAVDRKTTQSAIIDGMCLSIFGAIQPDVLMKYVSQATSGGELADGMLQRFQLAVFPDPTP